MFIEYYAHYCKRNYGSCYCKEDVSQSQEMQRDLQYRLPLLSPSYIGGCPIESVQSFKLLGMYLSSDIKWTTHCEYIIKRASKRLYILRQLRKACYGTIDLIEVYCCFIRPVLEYAVPVWASLPSYLSAEIESIQQRALKIIFKSEYYCYNNCLEKLNPFLFTREERKFAMNLLRRIRT